MKFALHDKTEMGSFGSGYQLKLFSSTFDPQNKIRQGLFLDKGSGVMAHETEWWPYHRGQTTSTNVLITEVKVSPKRIINTQHLLLIDITVDPTSYSLFRHQLFPWKWLIFKVALHSKLSAHSAMPQYFKSILLKVWCLQRAQRYSAHRNKPG